MYESERLLISHYDANTSYYSIFDKIKLPMCKLQINTNKWKSILDIGCGDGRSIDKMSLHDINYTGVDFSSKRISKAKYTYPNKNFIHQDIYKFLSQDTKKYDAIICFEVLEHLENPQIIVENIKKRLNPIGLLFGSVPKNHVYKAHLKIFNNVNIVKKMFNFKYCIEYKKILWFKWTSEHRFL